MKLRHIIFSTLVILTLFSFSGCGSNPQIPFELSCDQFNEEQHYNWSVNVDVGSSIVVTLCSNPTTGFEWTESPKNNDSRVLQKKEHKFISPETNLVGAAGKQTWSFKALKKGTTTVLFEYSQPWEGGEKSVWTLTANVVVK
jgi:inhibitor of cysteine peptidase